MMFPAELRFDYVRVYQRKGQTNTGCNPKNYPTADYIQNHLSAYTGVFLRLFPLGVDKVLMRGVCDCFRCEYDDLAVGKTEKFIG